MITIVAKCLIKKDKVEEFKALAKDLIQESRKESGCVAYHLNQDLNDENVLTFIEEWATQKDIELHNRSAHFTSIVPKLGEFQEKGSEVNLYKRV